MTTREKRAKRSMHSSIRAGLAQMLAALLLGAGAIALPACGGGDSGSDMDEAMEELQDEAEDAKEEIEDEIDDQY